MRVAFTGHRPDKLGGYDPGNTVRVAVKKALADVLTSLKDPDLVCLSGMALGFDQDAAAVCISLGVPFIAVVPFVGQDATWPFSSRKVYRDLLDHAQSEVVVCPGGYAPFKMQKRNEYLVDNSDLLIACWDGSPGGTANCVHYAEKVGREVKRLSW